MESSCPMLPILLVMALSADLPADEYGRVQVLGVSNHQAGGNRNVARRHRDCDQVFPGSHWCSTREYLDGGIADSAEQPLPTAWIRPSLVGGYGSGQNTVVYIDAAGLKAAKRNLNCSQWTSNSEEEQGFALQTTRDGKKQKVIQVSCRRKRPSLCCGHDGPER